MASERRIEVDGRMVLVGPPASSLARARRKALAADTELRRLYWPKRHGGTPTGLRFNGPRSRFDHHRRPGPFPAVADDAERGVLYAASTFECCLMECFGDRWLIEPPGARLAVLRLTEPLVLLDLRDDGATHAGTLAAINQEGDREVTQDWARWWSEQPELADIHGLLFAGAHNGEDALVVFERGRTRLAELFDAALTEPAVYAELLVAANVLDLPIAAGSGPSVA